ncbi:YjcZ family sporulation protein [Bacillus lacus]|uniref:YjcZ family sporulation protein n=1 Tax=Metabacillus lacus TaxID=1983721 RepID=A0A7X2IXI9_9BACI|nr:YjcZ family sporulation protein [Metabacillus lacus]MRX71658.1 YjcZ family sporulation protein [Metabacillus lacus]
MYGYGYGYGCCYPSYGYGGAVGGAFGAGRTFALIVVLFILLVIVGAAFIC